MNYLKTWWEELLKLDFKDGYAIWLSLIGGVLTLIFSVTRFLLKRYKVSILKDLSDYYDLNELKDATKYYIPTHWQSISSTETQEPISTLSISKRDNLIKHLYKNVLLKKIPSTEFKHFVILADSGMGKTTFLINLYLYYRRKINFVLGIKHAFRSYSKIELLPLASNDLEELIHEIKNKRDTYLLLDALDEDPKALLNAQARINDIIELTKDFKAIIITCRTQFFSAEQEEPYKTGLMKYGVNKGQHYFGKLYLSPFTPQEIKTYLRRKFTYNISKIKRANAFVANFPNIMVRPLLLSYIDELIFDINQSTTYSQVYALLINKWITREASVYDTPDTYKVRLSSFSKKIAFAMLQKQIEHDSSLLTLSEIETFAGRYDIQMSKFEMQTRSLLNRDSRGNFKFAHRSFLEYFFTLNIMDNPILLLQSDFNGLYNIPKFLCEMCFTAISKNNGLSLRFSYITYERDSGEMDFGDIIKYGINMSAMAISFDESYLALPNFHYYLLCFCYLKIYNGHIPYTGNVGISTSKQREVEKIRTKIGYLDNSILLKSDPSDVEIATKAKEKLEIELTKLTDSNPHFKDIDDKIIRHFNLLSSQHRYNVQTNA